ncbi:MAG: hypothetical protein LAO09_23025, partial [Acidobacteriia bacterium]|nr:hypothetical protein [Terriglobia bacterium]
DDLAPALNAAEVRFVRLGTLLPDIGHIAAGHTVEDELNLVPKHDADERLDLVLTTIKDRKGRTIQEVIDSQFARYVPPKLRQDALTPTQIVRLLIRKAPKRGEGEENTDAYKEKDSILSASGEIRMQVCHDMIGNTICADLLDYIHRDWYHVGKPRPFDERLLQYMEIRRGSGIHSEAGDPSDVFVISLGRRPKLRTDAVSNILELLEWRYQLAETVLFHRTKLAAAAMLDRALFELWGEEPDTGTIVKALVGLSDEEMLSSIAAHAEKVANEGSDKDQRARAGIAAKLLRQIERRELFKNLSTRFFGDLQGDVRVKAQKIYGKDEINPRQPARNRNKVVRMLEEDFNLPAGSIALYCPAGVNKKIAEVKIWVNGEIEPFCKYEDIHQEQLAGGHLAAQLRRFDRLWRLHFVIDPMVKNSLGERLYLLQHAVEKLAIGVLVDEEDFEHQSWSLAKALVQIEDSPWKDRQVAETVDASASASAALGVYPTDAPCIRNFFVPKK